MVPPARALRLGSLEGPGWLYPSVLGAFIARPLRECLLAAGFAWDDIGVEKLSAGSFQNSVAAALARGGERGGERGIRAAAVLELYRPAGCRGSPHHHFDKM